MARGPLTAALSTRLTSSVCRCALHVLYIRSMRYDQRGWGGCSGQGGEERGGAGWERLAIRRNLQIEDLHGGVQT